MARRSLRYPVEPSIAVGLVILLWLGYTTLQTLSVLEAVSETASVLLGFVPGVIGVAILLRAGLSLPDCFLRLERLSRAGLAVLSAVFVLALAAVLPIGEWKGWDWHAALVLAPATGVSQELFFRAALLPVLQRVWKRRPARALVVHSLLFGLWHIAPIFLGAPIWAVVAVILVPFVCGIGWGWQVQRDGTVIWAMLQHSLIWVIGLQFPLPG